MRRCIEIGSRESRLAVIQTRLVADYIENTLPEAEVRLLTMKTTGDRILDRPLEAVGGKGLFVKELDRALLEGRTELSVHSLKDLPMELPPELPILGFSRREDPRDVLVLPAGKPIGTGPSPWAAPASGGFYSCSGCIRRWRPPWSGATSRPACGSWTEGQYGALVLAAAGLKRLGLEDRDLPVFFHRGDGACGWSGYPGHSGPGGRGLRLFAWLF